MGQILYHLQACTNNRHSQQHQTTTVNNLTQTLPWNFGTRTKQNTASLQIRIRTLRLINTHSFIKMADTIAPQSVAEAPTAPHVPKTKYELKHERRMARQERREARRNDPERRARAGDVVGHVSNGLKLLTFGFKNPVSEIVGTVADGLKQGAGEKPNRDELDKAAHGKA